MINVIVRPYLTASIQHRNTGGMLKVDGIMQHEAGVINVLARRLEWVRGDK
jgi:hypothetical protein